MRPQGSGKGNLTVEDPDLIESNEFPLRLYSRSCKTLGFNTDIKSTSPVVIAFGHPIGASFRPSVSSNAAHEMKRDKQIRQQTRIGEGWGLPLRGTLVLVI